MNDTAPTLTVETSTAKGDKTDTIPLRRSHAKELRAWRKECGEPAPTARVFSGIPKGLVHRFKRDLEAAGIPFKDADGRQLDVHALRHTTATYLSKSGVAPRTAQEIMRHSDINLTMKAYTDPRLLDMAAAVEAMPDIGVAAGGVTGQAEQNSA